MGITELKTLTDLNFNIVVNAQIALLLHKTLRDKTDYSIAIGINNEGKNSDLKRVTKTAMSAGPKCNYTMLRLTQKEELTCPKSHTKSTRLAGRGEPRSGV